MSCGADPDGDSWGGKKFYAPLLVAASRQDKAMAELLLAYGAEEGRDSAMVQELLAGWTLPLWAGLVCDNESGSMTGRSFFG